MTSARPQSPALLIAIGLAAFVAASHAEAAVGAFAPSPALSAALLASTAAALLWAVRVARRPTPRMLYAGAAGAGALVLLWLTTRTVGLPLGLAPRAPVGVLDALTALDELLLAGFAISAAGARPRERWPALGSAAISLSFVALAMGCEPPAVHAAGCTEATPAAALVCHLY